MSRPCAEPGCDAEAAWEITLPGLRSERETTALLCADHAEERRTDGNVLGAERL